MDASEILAWQLAPFFLGLFLALVLVAAVAWVMAWVARRRA